MDGSHSKYLNSSFAAWHSWGADGADKKALAQVERPACSMHSKIWCTEGERALRVAALPVRASVGNGRGCPTVVEHAAHVEFLEEVFDDVDVGLCDRSTSARSEPAHFA